MLDTLLDFLRQCQPTTDVEKLDLTKEEDYKKFKDSIAELKEVEISNNLFSLVTSLFGSDLLDNLESIGDAIHDEAAGEECRDCVCTCQLDDEPKEYEDPCSVCEKEWCDGCQYEDNEVEQPEKFSRPSELTDTNTKLQIHHLVEEYTNEYIKPYVSKDKAGADLANNAYAGLFEFACWIYNHK